MEKLTRTQYDKDGKTYNEVAIIVSHGYGSGFSTWNLIDGLERNRLLCEPVAFGHEEEFFERLEAITGRIRQHLIVDFEDLKIHWIPEGSAYRIDEYDGSESLVTIQSLTQIA